jgi:pyruvate kinase
VESRAKIICTMGPAVAGRTMVDRLIHAGMDVARLNFSHGDHASHGRLIRMIRSGSRKQDRPVAILQDLRGIKIRTGLIRGGAAELKKGGKVFLRPGEGTGDERNLYVSYPSLLRDAKKGGRVLLDDGLIQLTITGKTPGSLIAKVTEGGVIRDRKGVNLPGMRISQRSFTGKDRRDLEFGLTMNVDYIAVSFVREASDIEVVKNWMRKKGKHIPIIAKIEKPEALENLENILDISDGIMIARGDLGVEVPPEEVPLIQKDLIDKANKKGKIVITATQMLESMTRHRRPTRAEATDIANAVIDGTDALMLSAETATGLYPVEALLMMDRIIRYTEGSRDIMPSYLQAASYADALADAACRAASDIRAKVLVAFTQSGFTARLLSKFRPAVPVIAFTPDRDVMARMSLFWGVTPKHMKSFDSIDLLIRKVEHVLIADRIVKKRDRIVIIASSPLPSNAKTNFMKLHEIGT